MKCFIPKISHDLSPIKNSIIPEGRRHKEERQKFNLSRIKGESNHSKGFRN
jgi:hypothetical protein